MSETFLRLSGCLGGSRVVGNRGHILRPAACDRALCDADKIRIVRSA